MKPTAALTHDCDILERAVAILGARITPFRWLKTQFKTVLGICCGIRRGSATLWILCVASRIHRHVKCDGFVPYITEVVIDVVGVRRKNVVRDIARAIPTHRALWR
jgi:hypothetical protein